VHECGVTTIQGAVDAANPGDTILDSEEGAGDADGDGTPNYLDADSDGDGIEDRVECDTDRDGVANFLDPDDEGPDCELFGLDFGSFFGICWYWWVLAAIIAFLLAMYGLRRRQREPETPPTAPEGGEDGPTGRE
jgi:hypothetical protein